MTKIIKAGYYTTINYTLFIPIGLITPVHYKHKNLTVYSISHALLQEKLGIPTT